MRRAVGSKINRDLRMPRNLHRVPDDRPPESIEGTSPNDIDDAADDEESLAFELAVWKAFRRLAGPADLDDRHSC